MRRVVLLPAEAEEHPKTVRLSSTNKAWRGAIPLAMFRPDPHSFLTQLFEVVMRLSCQKAFLLLLAATIGCSDGTGPVKPPASFELVNVNGRALPTFFSASPGLTPTIVSSYLFFGDGGKGHWLERRREFDGTETTISNDFEYTITFNQIQINDWCGAPDPNCVRIYKGIISSEALSLTISQLSKDYSVVYNYRKTLAEPL
jgi:hypothetical protein